MAPKLAPLTTVADQYFTFDGDPRAFETRGFFSHVRKVRAFDGKSSPGQVDGINRLLATWDERMAGPRDELAYIWALRVTRLRGLCSPK